MSFERCIAVPYEIDGLEVLEVQVVDGGHLWMSVADFPDPDLPTIVRKHYYRCLECNLVKVERMYEVTPVEELNRNE